MARFSFKPEPTGLGWFDPAGRFVARRPFTYEGAPIARGDALSIAVTGEAKMRKLHNARYVLCEPPPIAPPPLPPPAPEAGPPPAPRAARPKPAPQPAEPPLLYDSGAVNLPTPRAPGLDFRGAVMAPANEFPSTGARAPRKRQAEAPAADDAPQPPPADPPRAE